MNTNELLIKFYEDRIAHLEEMLEQSMEMNKKLIDKLAKRDDRPITPLPFPPQTTPLPRPPWTPVDPITDWKTCSKCGLKMEGVMGYCCPQPQCPTGLGGAWSTVKDPYLD